jgi:hypothetical protein
MSDRLTIEIQDMVTAWAGTRAPLKALEAGIRIIAEDCAAARVAELEREVAALREAIWVACEPLCSTTTMSAMSRRSPHKIVAIGFQLRAALAPRSEA